MSLHINPDRLRGALDVLSACSHDAQLLALKNLCENNGVWTIPNDASRYSPVLFEISLFGVPAMSDTIHELPRNWMRAAERILEHSAHHGAPGPTTRAA